MVDANEKKILIEYENLINNEIAECDKGIKATSRAIEYGKDTIQSLNQQKEKAEIGKTILKEVINSPTTPSAGLSHENLQTIITSFSDEQKNYQLLSLLNEQTTTYAGVYTSTAATATTLVSGSDTSGNVLFSIFQSSLNPQQVNKIKSDMDIALSENIRDIETELTEFNSPVIGSFNRFIREWWSLTDPRQKVYRLMDLRTDIFDKIFSDNCKKMKNVKYKDTVWFEKQIFPIRRESKDRYYCIIFFIMASNDGTNLPEHTIIAITRTADKLLKCHNKISDLGKKRKVESDEVVERLMRETINLVSDCMKMRNRLGGLSNLM